MKCSSARWRLIRVGLGLGVGLNSGFWVSGFGLVAGLRLGRVRDSGRGSGFRCSSTRGPRASLGPESKLRTTPLVVALVFEFAVAAAPFVLALAVGPLTRVLESVSRLSLRLGQP